MLVWIFVGLCVFALLVFMVWASADISSGVYLKALCKLRTERKSVVLTFDDGPDPDVTPKVLDMLDRYGVKAVFFLIGEKVLLHPEVVNEILRRGHLVGNHSFAHQSWFPLKGKLAVRAEIEKTERLLQGLRQNVSEEYKSKALFSESMQCPSNVGNVRVEKLFRPPFGVANPNIAHAVKSLDMNVIGWSIRTFDTSAPSPEKVVTRVRKDLEPGGIILLHDRLPECPEILESVLKMLTSEGYGVVLPCF